MYTLFWSANTGAFAPQAMLEEAGAAYELIPINLEHQENQQPEYLQINPLGQVPTLILPEGLVLTESVAMVLHLGDQFPETQLVPPIGDPRRALVYRWLLFQVCNIYETDLRVEHPDRYTSDPNSSPQVKSAAQAQLQRAWQILDRALDPGPFFLQDHYSALEIYLVMLAHWRGDVDQLLDNYPRIKHLCEQVRERPAIQKIWDQHFGHPIGQ